MTGREKREGGDGYMHNIAWYVGNQELAIILQYGRNVIWWTWGWSTQIPLQRALVAKLWRVLPADTLQLPFPSRIVLGTESHLAQGQIIPGTATYNDCWGRDKNLVIFAQCRTTLTTTPVWSFLWCQLKLLGLHCNLTPPFAQSYFLPFPSQGLFPRILPYKHIVH